MTSVFTELSAFLFKGEVMKKYVYIGLGGASGAVFRYLIKQIPIYNPKEIPMDTLLINIAGCFLLAFILTSALDILRLRPNLKLGISAGFLGAFTTFSTLCKETAILMSNGRCFFAVFYIIASVILGFTAVYLGFALANKIFIQKTLAQKDNLSTGLLPDIESESE